MWSSLLKSMALINSNLILQKAPNNIDYMIKTFRNQEYKQISERVGPHDMAPEVLRAAQRKLAMLDASDSREDLSSALGSDPNRVSGRKPKQGAQRFDDRWWLRFRWVEGAIYGVEITNFA